MKYGTTLIVVGLVNVFTIFSGFPLGWKKIIILITSFFIITIGWMLRVMYKRRQDRLRAEQEKLEEIIEEEISEAAEEIIESVNDQVDQEIDEMTDRRI